MFSIFKSYYLITIIAFFALLSSCDTVYEQKIEIADQEWSYKDSVLFSIDVTETQSQYNVFIDLENSDLYPFSNLYLFISIKSDDNKVITDTVDVTLADYKGQWYGDKSGDNYEGHYLFKRAIIFPKEGEYQFSIKHGMRKDTLAGITAVGISVEKFNQ